MAERLEEIERRLKSVGELHEIVGAMRALAAMRLEQANAALTAARAYSDAIAQSLAMALMTASGSQAPSGGRGSRALVVFTPEHGFSGHLAHNLIEAAQAEAAQGCAILLVGSRGAVFAEERGIEVVWQLPMATQLGAVAATARRVSEELHRRLLTGGLTGVQMMFAAYQRGGSPGIAHRRLLPLEGMAHRIPKLRAAPLTNMPPEDLMARLVEEYFFAELAHATIEMLAAENGARLIAMQSARRNIEEKLEELQRSEQLQRQSDITAEIAEISAGVAAFDAG